MDNQSKIASKWICTAYGDTSPSIKYIFPDHLGSSNTLCDDSGAFFNREEYYPFGETSFGSYGKKRYRYCGKEKDEESGMYYYGARYYLSWTCRFVSVDPIAGKYSNYTSYQYAGNKPINFIDLDGNEEADPWFLARYATKVLSGAEQDFVILYDATHSYKTMGGIIRNVLKDQGYIIGSNVSDEAIGKNLMLRVEDLLPVVKPREGFWSTALDFTVGALQASSLLMPGQDSDGALVVKMSPIFMTTVADVLNGLKRAAKIAERKAVLWALNDAARKLPLKEAEAEAAAIFEDATNTVFRASTNIGRETGTDLVAVSGPFAGETFSHIGILAKDMANFKMSDFLKSVERHLRISADRYLTDIRALNPAQQKEVIDLIGKNIANKGSNVIILK